VGEGDWHVVTVAVWACRGCLALLCLAGDKQRQWWLSGGWLMMTEQHMEFGVARVGGGGRKGVKELAI
jgi:hypothetical protein